MSKLVTLRDFLKEYNIKKEDFIKETDKDKSFYEQYIEWEDMDDATIISPKALNRLCEVFETSKNNNLTDKHEDKEVKTDTVRKRRVKKEEVNNYMPEPITDKESERIEKPKEAAPPPKPKKKKTKLNLTKQFIQEHGYCDDKGNFDIKDLRKFLIGSGLYKLEQVAIMGDDEVLGVISKDYYFINSPEGVYIIKRSSLQSIISDAFIIEK